MSCVKAPWLTAAWAGRLLNQQAIAELQAIRQQTGLDLCGEEGEYHTLVTDAPDFRSRIQLGDFEVCTRDAMAWLKIPQPVLQPKAEQGRRTGVAPVSNFKNSSTWLDYNCHAIYSQTNKIFYGNMVTGATPALQKCATPSTRFRGVFSNKL
jgi:hypothetical protein